MLCIIALEKSPAMTKNSIQIINRKAKELKQSIYVFEKDEKTYVEMPVDEDFSQTALNKIYESLKRELEELDRRLNDDANC